MPGSRLRETKASIYIGYSASLLDPSQQKQLRMGAQIAAAAADDVSSIVFPEWLIRNS